MSKIEKVLGDPLNSSKTLFLQLIIVALLAVACTARKSGGSSMNIEMEPDTTSVLKNPAMGWVMYNEGWELYSYYQENFDHLNVDSFWKQMDEVNAHEVSNILYIRAIWSAFEPEEGEYAWEHDPDFIKLIEGAKERNLKLAFRVFHHSGSQVQQATPDYVFEAGAQYEVSKKGSNKRGFKNPYYDDPVFMQKFNTFVAALAAEFDDPEVTDFVDGYGAGLWGEGHNLLLIDKNKKGEVIDRITGIYESHFKNILTVYNLSSADWKYAGPLVFENKHFLPRRDGLGSYWFAQKSRDRVDNYFFPKYPLMAEGCYWLNSKTQDTTGTAYKTDKQFEFHSWREALSFGMEDALNHHANIYDLRVPLQAKFWIKQAPDAVQKFITHGGYRLYPNEVNIRQTSDSLIVESSWENLGVGVLPNHHPNWNGKYKLAWGLKHKESAEVTAMVIEGSANPGDWIKGEHYLYITEIKIPQNVKSEDYFLVTAIVNERNNQAEIELALKEKPKDKWYKISSLTF
ncbi:hypothetical protein [Echinicola shivajiensis]|uniref:hypothetical protein n=1 Tax=Echinicola shivajiensis TaxID=1035916 RepID=UPI001BFCBB2A|nr:hypothetical protein [Echinicola shivajiensis]